MGEHQSDAIHTAPLHLTRGNELINHDLSAVGKVAKLGFPNHQGIGVVRSVTVLKAQHGFLGQNRVNDHERRLIFRDVLQRNISARVPLLATLIVNHRMAMGKGSTTAVLAGQAHRESTGHQRGQCHVLSHAPIDRNISPTHGSTVIIDFANQLVRCDRGRNGGDFFSQALPLSEWNGRVSCIGPFFTQIGRPIDHKLTLEVGHNGVNRMTARIQSSAVGFDHIVTQRFAQAL